MYMLVSVNITKRKLNHYGQHIRNIIIKATVRNMITAGRVQALHSASPFPPRTAPVGEMSPNGIPKYLKRPLWRERKWAAQRRGWQGSRGPRRARDRGTASGALVARHPRPPPASRIPAHLPPNLFRRSGSGAAAHPPSPRTLTAMNFLQLLKRTYLHDISKIMINYNTLNYCLSTYRFLIK